MTIHNRSALKINCRNVRFIIPIVPTIQAALANTRSQSACSQAQAPAIIFSKSECIGFQPNSVMSFFGLAHNTAGRSEEHTSELQSLRHLVCRLLLEKKK